MGWMSTAPVLRHAVDTGEHTIPLTAVHGGHGIDRHRLRTWNPRAAPVIVEQTGRRRRYRLSDNTHRVEAARRAGATHIQAIVWYKP